MHWIGAACARTWLMADGEQMQRAAPRSDPGISRASWSIIAAIVLLLIYQGYTLSVSGIASPWIAKSFNLTQPQLAGLFAWMSVSAFGSMLLARLADRVGRRRIILTSLVLAPFFALGAALAPW